MIAMTASSRRRSVTMNPEIVRHSRILIVDDQEANIQLLQRILEHEGYWHIKGLTDATRALQEFETLRPDLLLLDLMMPRVDGYTILGELRKRIPDSDYLPILVITADASTAARQKALSLGAKDFLNKPIDAVETALRVYNLLETRWLYCRLQTQNVMLEDTVAARTHELRDAHRRLAILDRAKSDFLKLISHEFRTPLNGILGAGEILLDQLATTPDVSELRDIFGESRQRILAILDDALLLGQIEVEGEKFCPVPIALNLALRKAIEEVEAIAAARHVHLQSPQGEVGLIWANEQLLVRALRALLETAIKFTLPSQTVAMAVELTPDAPTVIIESPNGRLPDPAVARFFDLFSTEEATLGGRDIGLGPPVASRILSLFGGEASVANRDPAGIRLKVSCRPAARYA